MAVARLQSLANESEVDVTIDKPQQMIFGNVILQPKVIEERFRTSLLTHHDKYASADFDQERHLKELNGKTFAKT